MGVPIGQVARTLGACKALFFALGDGTRQQIILLLEKSDALNVTQLTKKLPRSRPAISHHLQVLRRAGLVAVRRQGTENFYSLDRRRVGAAEALHRRSRALRTGADVAKSRPRHDP